MISATIVQPDNVAVVTGAAMGIGREMCLQLAAAGMSVVLADLAGDELDAAVRAVSAIAAGGSNSILAAPTDVADPVQIDRLRDIAIAKFGKINFLANNAVTRIGRGHDAELADWRRAIEINLWGAIYGARAFLPDMLASSERAAIVNVGSKQGITNPPGHPIYNIAKAALKTYTEGSSTNCAQRKRTNPRVG